MTETINFEDKYTSIKTSDYVIKVSSETNRNLVYLIRCGPYECSCPAYQRFSTPWMQGEGYICKHMKKILDYPLDIKNMLAIIRATDGNMELFLKNYNFTELLILYFRQEVYIDNKKDKIVILE